MCGIVAYCGHKRPNIASLKLMTLMQISRGRAATGFQIGKHITKRATAPDTFFTSLVWSNNTRLTTNIAMLHNRMPTSGVNNEDNAHPFVYPVEDSDHFASFIHNGTLTNVDELCANYNLDKKQFDVDSKLLGHIIFNYGFDVLSQYKGAAAFVYQDTRFKDTLWVWKGASRQLTEVVEEERPLFYAKKESGMYLASTKDALVAGTDSLLTKIFAVPDNTLYKIVAGEIVEETIYDRSHIPKKETAYYSGRSYHEVNGKGSANDVFGYGYGNNGTVTAVVKKIKEVAFSLEKPQNLCVDSYEKGEIYYQAGRFYNGRMLAEGEFLLDADNKIVYENMFANVYEGRPANTFMGVDDDNVEYLLTKVYFSNGYKLRSEQAWRDFKRTNITKREAEKLVAYDQVKYLDPDYAQLIPLVMTKNAFNIAQHGIEKASGQVNFKCKFSKFTYYFNINENTYQSIKNIHYEEANMFDLQENFNDSIFVGNINIKKAKKNKNKNKNMTDWDQVQIDMIDLSEQNNMLFDIKQLIQKTKDLFNDTMHFPEDSSLFATSEYKVLYAMMILLTNPDAVEEVSKFAPY